MPLNITLCAINSQDTGCLARQCDQIETCRRAVLHCEDRALMVSHIIVALIHTSAILSRLQSSISTRK